MHCVHALFPVSRFPFPEPVVSFLVTVAGIAEPRGVRSVINPPESLPDTYLGR